MMRYGSRQRVECRYGSRQRVECRYGSRQRVENGETKHLSCSWSLQFIFHWVFLRCLYMVTSDQVQNILGVLQIQRSYFDSCLCNMKSQVTHRYTCRHHLPLVLGKPTNF